MKTFKIVALIVFVFSLNTNKLSAQAVVEQSNLISLKVSHPNPGDEKIQVPSISSRFTISSNGNIVKTAKFILPADNFLVPEKGVRAIAVRLPLTYDENGEVVDYMVDYDVKIKSSGEFKVVLHSNGGGTSFPNFLKE